MVHNNIGEDSAPYKKLGGEAQVSWLQDGDQVIDNTVGNGLMESGFVTVRPDIELEALKLDALFVRNIVEDQGGEIRLPGFGAEAGKLRDLHVNMIIPCRCRIGEDFQLFCGAAGHSLISVKSVRMVCPRLIFRTSFRNDF